MRHLDSPLSFRRVQIVHTRRTLRGRIRSVTNPKAFRKVLHFIPHVNEWIMCRGSGVTRFSLSPQDFLFLRTPDTDEQETLQILETGSREVMVGFISIRREKGDSDTTSYYLFSELVIP